MISCKNVTKLFSEHVVLNSFSYDFAQTGFYLLFGESGSGKTTLLNILSGFLPFDGGHITFGNNRFTSKVENEYVKYDFDYITQDTFFVDFLSVMDNMRLITDSDDEIMQKLEQFGLAEKANRMPTTLSGGEKQRLAIVRSVIRHKKVLFLDEPSAALDENNKHEVFKLLAELKQNILIICTSHDPQAKIYADKIINFSKEKTDTNSVRIVKPPAKTEQSEAVILPTYVTNKAKNKKLYDFLKQWFRSERRNKKANVLFTVFLVLALCICIFADTPENKLNTAIENMYKINMMTVITTGKTTWNDIAPSKRGIRSVVLDYAYSCPNGTENLTTDDMMVPMQAHEIFFNVLPFDSGVFKLSDKILYGAYFSKEDQIILSAEMANALYPSFPEKLIGEHIKRTVYGLGEINFEIVGIFDYFNDFEKMYLKALSVNIETGKNYNADNYSDLFFVNSKLTEKLENDETYYSGSSAQRGYQIFFDSYRDMKSYYDKYGSELNENKNVTADYSRLNNNLYDVFQLLFYIMLPIAVFIVLFTVLFFIQLKKTEFIFNSQFISVFEYSGYAKEKVINYFILLNIRELIKLYTTAALLTFAVTWIVNGLNNRFAFVNFQIFSYNIWIISAFLLFLILIAFIFINIIFRKVKVSSWYENLIAARDLI